MAPERRSFWRSLTPGRQELSPSEERCRSIIVPNGAEKMRSIVLWLVGVPIPIIILLWFFMK
jgi:hypothetical protein